MARQPYRAAHENDERRQADLLSDRTRVSGSGGENTPQLEQPVVGTGDDVLRWTSTGRGNLRPTHPVTSIEQVSAASGAVFRRTKL